MMEADFKKSDRLILFPPEKSSLKPFFATAAEDKDDMPGDSAMFRVWISTKEIPWVDEMVINVNGWDVYSAESVEGLTKFAEHYAG